MSSRCDLCFKEKSPLQSPFPQCQAKVCKGCFYEIDRIIGFLLHYGVRVALEQAELPFNPPKPPKKSPKVPKSKSEGVKSRDNTTPLK